MSGPSRRSDPRGPSGPSGMSGPSGPSGPNRMSGPSGATRAAVLAGAVLAGAVLAGACGGSHRPTGGVERDDAIIQLRSNVRDAQVYIDGRFVAPLEGVARGIAMRPGFHRIELRRDDYFSSYLELELTRAERRKVRMELAPVLP